MTSPNSPQPVAELVERFDVKGWNNEQIELSDPEGEWVRYSDHASALTAKDAEIERLRRERAESLVRERHLRGIISSTHKHGVKHENCEIENCPICDGGLFVCADCGAAEVECEERICTAAESEAASLRKQVEERDALLKRCESQITSYVRKGLVTDAEMSAQQASDMVDTHPIIVAIRRTTLEATDG